MKKLLSLLTLIFAVMLLATTSIATAADKTTDIIGKTVKFGAFIQEGSKPEPMVVPFSWYTRNKSCIP